MLARQPWIYRAPSDLIFILSPAFVVTAAVLLFPEYFSGETSPWAWILLVVGIDVAHVYSTLFRTYFDKEARKRYRELLVGIPIACWVGGVVLYGSGKFVFWRVLGYLAVFHFVRQQYGFFRLYARKDRDTVAGIWVDRVAIYGATLYPVLYWHTHPRSFHWFLEGDFVPVPWVWLERAGAVIYGLALLLYVLKEVGLKRWNLPKNLMLFGTAASWYCGIVLYNGDLTFTLTNVVAHGVPYLALIWFYQRKQGSNRNWFTARTVPVYAVTLVVLAYVEEAFWDALVWRDHTQWFAWLAVVLPQLEDRGALALVVPLLAVPQATHYVLDGFIWRQRDWSQSRQAVNSVTDPSTAVSLEEASPVPD